MKNSFNSEKIEENQHAFCFHVENYCDRSTPHVAETDPLETMFQNLRNIILRREFSKIES